MAVFVHTTHSRTIIARIYTAAGPWRRKQYLLKIWNPPEIRRLTDQVQAVWEAKYKTLPISNHQPCETEKELELSTLTFDTIFVEFDATMNRKFDGRFLAFVSVFSGGST
jgi:hypothetical protein